MQIPRDALLGCQLRVGCLSASKLNLCFEGVLITLRSLVEVEHPRCFCGHLRMNRVAISGGKFQEYALGIMSKRMKTHKRSSDFMETLSLLGTIYAPDSGVTMKQSWGPVLHEVFLWDANLISRWEDQCRQLRLVTV